MASAPELIDHYRKVHASRVYGTSSVKYVRFLRPWIRLLRPASILDFGCGQSAFLDILELGWPVALHRYDPAIPAYARPPRKKVDLLINIDVLEHIDEAELPAVLRRMRDCCREAVIVVDTAPSKHTLADGRNAHVTLHDAGWWRERVEAVFGPVEPIRTARRSRAAFKTWKSPPGEWLRYRLLRAGENLRHYARRLVGRHKQHWKKSSLGSPEA